MTLLICQLYLSFITGMVEQMNFLCVKARCLETEKVKKCRKPFFALEEELENENAKMR